MAASLPAHSFWRDYLQSASQSLDLVLDKTRTPPSTTAPRHEVALTCLPEQLWQDGCGGGVNLLAAFHAYLARTCSQELITLGVQPSLLLSNAAAAGQQQEQTPLVPLCCAAVRPQDTIHSHAQQLHNQLQQLLPHCSAVSLADICAAAGIQPASSMQHPLFQAGVAVATTRAAAAEAAAGLDLVLVLLAAGDDNSNSSSSNQVYLLYNSGLFTQEGAQAMAQHLQVYLHKLLTPSGPQNTPLLLTAPLMDAAEQQLVMCGFNDTDRDYDRHAFVHGLFMQHARNTPHAPCVVFEDAVFSYAEIDAASNRIANYLTNEAGVSPGSIVGVLLLRSPLMVSALLGILKAGAGYLPLDHHHPEGRIAFMLEDAAVKAVVVQPDLLHKLPDAAALDSLSIHTLLLHPEVPYTAANRTPHKSLRATYAHHSATAAAATTTLASFPPVVPSSLAAASFGAAAASSPVWQHGQLGDAQTTCYIIYTSGSTGKPKGVVVQHQGLTAYVAWFKAFFGITSADVFLQKTPTNFDASIDELWVNMSAGARLVVAPPEAHRDTHSVMMLITRHSVTTSSAVPSQLQALAREILALHGPDAAAAGQAPCSSLKRGLSGGEALTTTMAQDISTAMPRCKLFNTYGPTETTVGITAWLYEPPAAATSSSSSSDAAAAAPVAATIPIGTGIQNSRLYVLDSALKPVPIGVPGELWISGVQVTWGYLNRPDLNEAVFVPNPFCEGPGTHTDRMYKAGDLVRWLPGRHACLEFLGRVDHQVKLRGFRIELQEIEAALGALPGVSQVATALAKNPTTNQDQLVAWVSPDSLDAQGLVQQLHGMLPEYMIPTVVVRMTQLPLLPSEKVNRKALPTPDFARDAVRPPVKKSAASTKQQQQRPAAAAATAAIAKATAPVRTALATTSSSSSSGASSWSSGGVLSSHSSIGSWSSDNSHHSNVAGSSCGTDDGGVCCNSSTVSWTSDSNSASSGSPRSVSATSPRMDPLMLYVAGAWAAALGCDAGSISTDDNFFALGGNSLLCGRMNSALRSGLSLPSMSGMLIYQHPSLAEFTQAVAAAGGMLPAAFRRRSTSSSRASSSDEDSSMTHSDDSLDMPADTLFSFVAAAWAETLGGIEASSLTGDADFFALGGNSLLCGKMNSRLRLGLNLPGLSGMLIYQNTTLQAFTDAVAQAGATLPGSSSSGRGSGSSVASYSSSTVSGSSAAVSSHNSSSFGGFFRNSSSSSGWGSGAYASSSSGGSSSGKAAGQGSVMSATANAAAQAAAAAFVHEHPVAPGDWTLSSSYEQSMAAASKAAYAAASAAYNTVMATLGIDVTGMEEANGGGGSSSSSAKKKQSLDALAGNTSSSIFSKSFRTAGGAGTAGGLAIPVYDAFLAPNLPFLNLPNGSSKGPSIKPEKLQQQQQQKQTDVNTNSGSSSTRAPSMALCTAVQVLALPFISGTMHALSVMPMLAWMLLMSVWGFRAFALLPLLSLLGLVTGVGLVIAGKWLFVGRYREGEHPIWGWFFIRHWLSNQFIVSARNSFLPLLKRTTLVTWFYRALGMRVGQSVLIDTDDFLGYDLIDVKDDAVLDMFCGITAISYEAGTTSADSKSFPTGKMTIKRSSVGKGAVVGAHAMVVHADVADGSVVQPCTASNNPCSVFKGTRWPQTGPDAVVAAKSQDKPLGVLSGLAALILTDLAMGLITYPITMGMLLFWSRLSGYSWQQLPLAAGDGLQCLAQLPGLNPLSPEAAAKCHNLMLAGIKAMLVYPTVGFLASQLLIILIIPYKWLVRGRIKPDAALTLNPTAKSWGERFRSHLLQVMLDHPGLKMVLYMWTGTAMFNAWLRGMGAKVGRQAWIGEGLQLFEHDLVEIGNCVSVCSEVSMMPSTVMGSRKIVIKGGSDVTNQTCLYPGVTVMPGACLGVFTFAEAERTFPRNSIVQGPMVLMPGQAEPEDGGPAVDSDPGVNRQVSAWQYFKFNAFYTALMAVLLPLTVQFSTMPFYIASTVLVFKYGILWGVLLVPVSWSIDMATDFLWMMLVKKVLLRRCTGNNPFYHYTHTAWMITGILFYFHQATLLKYVSGSQMAVWYYRAMGATIGKGVLLNSLASNEPDCLTIGDGTVIDDLSFVMAHTTENRCVKFHDVTIGSRVTIGCGSAVMPGVVINDEAVIGDVSIVMKGETVPAGAVWRGVPAIPVMEQA